LSVQDRLYEKLSDEFDRFIEELKGLPPDGIIGRAYEKVIKEDILSCFYEDSLTDAEAQALLDLENPLDDLYTEWQESDVSFMDSVRDIVDNKAKSLLSPGNEQIYEPAEAVNT